MQYLQAGMTHFECSMNKIADGTAITSGTVNCYVVSMSGTNIGKWFKDSDNTLTNASETVAKAMTHLVDGTWYVDFTNSPFAAGIDYCVYFKESGNLHVAGNSFHGRGVAAIQSVDLVNAPNSTAVTAIAAGVAANADIAGVVDRMEALLTVAP